MSVSEHKLEIVAALNERATNARARWWNDRALLSLLVLFVVVMPFVTQRIYASDEIKYFAYTHSLFFDHDLDFSDDYLHWYTDVDPVKFLAIYDGPLQHARAAHGSAHQRGSNRHRPAVDAVLCAHPRAADWCARARSIQRHSC